MQIEDFFHLVNRAYDLYDNGIINDRLELKVTTIDEVRNGSSVYSGTTNLMEVITDLALVKRLLAFADQKPKPTESELERSIGMDCEKATIESIRRMVGVAEERAYHRGRMDAIITKDTLIEAEENGDAA